MHDRCAEWVVSVCMSLVCQGNYKIPEIVFMQNENIISKRMSGLTKCWFWIYEKDDLRLLVCWDIALRHPNLLQKQHDISLQQNADISRIVVVLCKMKCFQIWCHFWEGLYLTKRGNFQTEIVSARLPRRHNLVVDWLIFIFNSLLQTPFRTFTNLVSFRQLLMRITR